MAEVTSSILVSAAKEIKAMKKTIKILAEIILFIIGFNICAALLSMSDTIVNFLGLALTVLLIGLLVHEGIRALKILKKHSEDK